MVVVSSRDKMAPFMERSMRLVGGEKGMRRRNDGRGCHEKRCRRVELHGRMMVQISISFFDLWIEHLALYKLLLLTVVLLLLEATGMGGFRLVSWCGASLSSTKSSCGGLSGMREELSKTKIQNNCIINFYSILSEI